MTLHIVRNSVVHASLWNTITIDVVGSLVGYRLLLQLIRGQKKCKEIIIKNYVLFTIRIIGAVGQEFYCQHFYILIILNHFLQAHVFFT